MPALVGGLDLVGVAVFAASGASAGVAKRLDLFGVAFVGVVAALGGGVVRDLVIGDVPPVAFVWWPYLTVAAGVALLVFYIHPQLGRLRKLILVLDAAGLGLFTVVGTLKALDAGVPALGSCVIGMITGIGGGLGRDLLTGEIPVVLRREIYAVASLLGAVAITAASAASLPPPAAAIGAAILVFAVRMLALYRKWSAPVPSGPGT
ncbi:MAG: trimeric intracellular cation channel family protein [Micromonosporaceae bacterium]